MIENLDDSDFSIQVSARNNQIPVVGQGVRILGIDSESTIVAFNGFVCSVKPAGSRIRPESDPQFLSLMCYEP
jgi:hypothetical protein